MRSAYAPAVAALVALIAALARWAVQGSGNLYSAIDKRFYVPDPDLGWTVSPHHPIWLGLEVCAILAGIALALTVGGYVIRRLEARGRRTRLLRIAMWVAGVVPLAVPIAAFASGGAPAGARDVLPAAQAVALETGIEGALALPSGRFDVVAHAGTAITVKVSAGGETFDARFASDITGSLTLDPRVLAAPITSEVSVATDALDTGIGERTKHAREAYLRSDRFPRITFTLDAVIAARQESPEVVVFRARGTLGLIGKRHAVEVTGRLSRPDAVGLARLGLSGDVLLATAALTLSIKETALAPDAGDFDGDQLPIQISLVLRHSMHGDTAR